MNTPYGRTIVEERIHTETNEQKIQKIREWANQLQGGGDHTRGQHPVRIKMPSGAIIPAIGGETLVQALANGGQPMDEPKMKPTVNGQVAGYRPIQFL
jgi:hypothetical protein